MDLLCFAHAGSGASTYSSWGRGLRVHGINIVAIEYPGHGSRCQEPCARTMSALVRDAADQVARLATQTAFACYGHSMGALVAFELTRELQRRGAALPRRLFLGARRAPDALPASPPIDHLDDLAFLDALRERFGDTSDVLRDNAEARALFLPMLRTDFRLVDDYQGAGEPVAVPFTVIASRRDPWAQRRDLAAWERFTTCECRFEEVEGDHFFHLGTPGALWALLAHSIATDARPADCR